MCIVSAGKANFIKNTETQSGAITLTKSYLTSWPVETKRFQIAVTKRGRYGWNSSSYFWAYRAALSHICDFSSSTRPASSSSYRDVQADRRWFDRQANQFCSTEEVKSIEWVKTNNNSHLFVKAYYPKSEGHENLSSRFPCCLQKTLEDPA